MTALEKLRLEHPEITDGQCYSQDGAYCPSDFGYLKVPEGSCFSTNCKEYWDREIPETNLVIGDSKIEHPDTDIPAKKMIYAHIGHPDPVGEPGEPGVLSVGCAGCRSELTNNSPICKICVDHDCYFPRDDEESGSVIVNPKPHILDSGNRRQFESGAVRDIQEGKGRCDLLPLDVVAEYMNDPVLFEIALFTGNGNIQYLYDAISHFINGMWDVSTMFLEVSKHFEEGAKKYGENNWQKGIPVHCYIDSAVRHYLKFLRGDKDEPHDRAFCWNIMCAIWTCKHKPELNEYDIKQVSENVKNEMIAERKQKSVSEAYSILRQAIGHSDIVSYPEAVETAIGYLEEVLL